MKRASSVELRPETALIMPSTPTVLVSGPYRIFFYSGDRVEPPHVQVERDQNVAKFWLDPIRLQSSGGFPRREIRRIRLIIADNQTMLMERWNEHFGI